eukprot:CAMPEP_0168459192 /NCGR_PEP_ID=MMETSP0228-20121227/52782_1 /TAXON_ID=133427 /ORGANISM="Protoceratium reticulatum, Strain CCCM 535 (=CCMP 1889)" /LENGTH=68 /DNA_ID=CAMNT_0008474347 /DNA_START=10 /DNA_END=213 /DNA_ORIENTATION=-
MNARQVISILVSYATYKHPISGLQVIGLLLVFCGLFYKSFAGFFGQKELQPLLKPPATPAAAAEPAGD